MMDSATAAGFSDPSISTVMVTVDWAAPGSSATSVMTARARMRAPTFTGEMNRTF